MRSGRAGAAGVTAVQPRADLEMGGAASPRGHGTEAALETILCHW